MKRKANRTFQEETINPFEIQNNPAELKSSFDLIDSKDIRLKFKDSTDPINLAFESIESSSVRTLAKDFVRESLSDFVSFVSKICK